MKKEISPAFHFPARQNEMALYETMTDKKITRLRGLPARGPSVSMALRRDKSADTLVAAAGAAKVQAKHLSSPLAATPPLFLQ